MGVLSVAVVAVAVWPCARADMAVAPWSVAVSWVFLECVVLEAVMARVLGSAGAPRLRGIAELRGAIGVV
jgi:hypothetical protein